MEKTIWNRTPIIINKGSEYDYPIGNCTDIKVESTSKGFSVTWTDPEDEYYKPDKYQELYPIALYAGTRVVFNADRIPENENDGIMIVDSKKRNQYQGNGFEYNELGAGVSGFLKCFPYTEGVFTNDDENAVEVAGEHTVTFLNIGGTFLATDKVIHGGTAVFPGELPTEPDDPSKVTETFIVSGGGVYRLIGWSLSDNNEPVENLLVDVKTDMTVYACYEELPTQYWLNADGSQLAETHYEIGTVAVYPNGNPTLSGTTWPFTGWSPSNLTVNAKVMTFYAQYQMPDGWSSDMSWADIIQKHDNGTYTQIPLGTKAVAGFGSYGLACMQLVGVNTDTKSSGGNAKTTWIATTILPTTTQWNASDNNAGGWPSSKIRTYCQSVFGQLQSDIKARIDTVTKYSFSADPNNMNLSSTDQLWIPNFREMNLSSTTLETSGPRYSSVYTNDNARIKRNDSGTTSIAWLRSAISNNYRGASAIDTYGKHNVPNTSTSNGVCPGFCLS